MQSVVHYCLMSMEAITDLVKNMLLLNAEAQSPFYVQNIKQNMTSLNVRHDTPLAIRLEYRGYYCVVIIFFQMSC